MTMRWANNVFCFILAVTVVNIQNAAVYFLNKSKLDALHSRRQIAKQLIYNCYLVEEQQARKPPRWGSVEHSLIMVPINKKLSKGDWCPVRQNMASGSAPVAVNLCVHTASALQD